MKIRDVRRVDDREQIDLAIRICLMHVWVTSELCAIDTTSPPR